MRGVEPAETDKSAVCVAMGKGRKTHQAAATVMTKTMPNVSHRLRQNHFIAAPAESKDAAMIIEA
jgi:hypothetical protein